VDNEWVDCDGGFLPRGSSFRFRIINRANSPQKKVPIYLSMILFQESQYDPIVVPSEILPATRIDHNIDLLVPPRGTATPSQEYLEVGLLLVNREQIPSGLIVDRLKAIKFNTKGGCPYVLSKELFCDLLVLRSVVMVGSSRDPVPPHIQEVAKKFYNLDAYSRNLYRNLTQQHK